MNHGRGLRDRRSWLLLAAPIVLTFAAMTAATVLGGDGSATKGRIPDRALMPDGQIDSSLVPDFVVVLGRDGNPVGYVSRDNALGLGAVQVDDTGRPIDVSMVVFGEDLATVVGHMVPGRGFVPLGTNPVSVPEFKVTTGPVEQLTR